MDNETVWVKLEWADGTSSITGPLLREHVESKTQEELRQCFLAATDELTGESPRPVRVILTEPPTNWWRNGKRIV